MSQRAEEAPPSPLKIVAWAGLALVVLVIFGIFASFLSAGASVATAPARVLDQTMTTQNIIDSYEGFRDRYTQYGARIAQIHEFEQRVKAHVSEDEMDRLQTELSGQRGSCRDLAAAYNAEALKTNHNIFKNPPIVGGPILPDALDMGACDA